MDWTKDRSKLATKQKVSDSLWIAKDWNSTQWECTREPFDNGFGVWFVELKNPSENLEDFMKRS